MKLLLDENISDRVAGRICDLYPDSAHLKSHSLIRSDDSAIWTFAQEHDFIIVSKDADFYQRSFVYGTPPKVVLLRVGNCSTSRITEILRSSYSLISSFGADPKAAILILI